MENFGLEILTIGQLATNCYLIFDPKNGEGLIIDPGDEANYITQVIMDKKIRPLMILATHGHFDHLFGVQELKLAYEIPFLIHQKDEFLLKNINKSARYFLHIKQVVPPPSVSSFLKEGQKIPFGQFYLEVLETPGHTPGSVCFYFKKKKIIFCGDTLFKNGVGRTDFSYSSKTDLQKSLQKIHALPPQTICYPGHGPKTTV